MTTIATAHSGGSAGTGRPRRAKHTRASAAPTGVERTTLVDALQDAAALVSVVAPAGYGKTTTLRQLQDLDARPFGWLTLDEEDDDVARLLARLIAIVDARHTTPVDSMVGPGSSRREMTEWFSARTSPKGGAVLVMEGVDTLTNPAAQDLVAVVAEYLPAPWQVVVTSRAQPLLPLARLRAEGRLAEVGVAELAMDDDEARQLLDAEHVNLSRADAGALNQAVEGWPAALHLAAVAIVSSPESHEGQRWPRGTDRAMADYLQSEVLSRIPADAVDFLTTTSLPEKVSGPLCDALLNTDGSGQRLAELEASTGLVIALDRERQWYRYHPLLRDLLQAQLASRQRGRRIPLLRRRAADWFEANGMLALAIDEAVKLDDLPTVSRLVSSHGYVLFQRGHLADVKRWLHWIDHHGEAERDPRQAVLGGLVETVAGNAGAAERWMAAAEHAAVGKPTATRREIAADLAVLKAARCDEGPARMAQAAADAVALLAPNSPWMAGGLTLLGMAQGLMGELEQADVVLRDAAASARSSGAWMWASLALAERALVARHQERPRQYEKLAKSAITITSERGLQGYATSALALAVTASTSVAGGDVKRGKRRVVRAQRLRTRATETLPVFATQVSLELAEVALAMTDVTGARTELRRVNDLLYKGPRSEHLEEHVEQLRRRANALHGNMAGASLTSAELRLLPLLASYLSFRQIGERLFISVNTVKTEAISIYRKLGVSSRAEAVDRASQLGLIPEPLPGEAGQFTRSG